MGCLSAVPRGRPPVLAGLARNSCPLMSTTRNLELEALLRFIERHTYREACSLPWLRQWEGEYPAQVLNRSGDCQSLDAEERHRFLQGLSSQRQVFQVVLLTDGMQQQFEIVPTPRPEVRVFCIDGTDAIVTVHQGAPVEAAYYWARCRPRLQVPKSLLNPRARGPVTSFQPVYLPFAQFA
ncbi:MAG: hypothetical protein WCP34_17065 [Pseudomonadota bacterium]